MPNGVLIDGGEVLLHSTIDGGEVALTRNVDGGEIGESFQPLPHISIGEVTTLPAGSEATATMTGTSSQPLLNLGLVKGDNGNRGDTGLPAGFGTVTATVDNNVGTPSVEVTTSGTDTEKNFAFAFHNLKGEGSVRSVNNQTGDVVLDAEDVGALPSSTVIPSKTSDLTNDSGFITGMTILSYGSSTWQNFLDAYNANKVVYCRASSNANPATGSQTRLAFMAYVNNASNPSSVEFQYYRSIATHTAEQQGDQVFVYTLTSTGWSVITREAVVKVTAGSNMTQSFSNGTLTLNASNPPVTSVNNQSGAVVLTASDVGALPNNTSIPSKTSDLTNDSGFLTLSTLPIWDGSVN